MIEIIKADGRAEGERIDAMRARAAQVGAGIQRAVSAVMEDVKARGYEAVKEYSLRFDGTEPYELSQADLTAAWWGASSGASPGWAFTSPAARRPTPAAC